MVRAAALGLALALSLTVTATASVQLPEKVRYSTEGGKSDWQETDVTFASGSELNTATHSFDYETFSNYAIVFFTQHQAAVIEISTTLFCGGNASESCVKGALVNLEGADKEGRQWEICTSGWCY